MRQYNTRALMREILSAQRRGQQTKERRDVLRATEVRLADRRNRTHTRATPSPTSARRDRSRSGHLCQRAVPQLWPSSGSQSHIDHKHGGCRPESHSRSRASRWANSAPHRSCNAADTPTRPVHERMSNTARSPQMHADTSGHEATCPTPVSYRHRDPKMILPSAWVRRRLITCLRIEAGHGWIPSS